MIEPAPAPARDRTVMAWLEDPRFGDVGLTPGQRYVALLLVVLCILLVTVGLPAGGATVNTTPAKAAGAVNGSSVLVSGGPTSGPDPLSPVITQGIPQGSAEADLSSPTIPPTAPDVALPGSAPVAIPVSRVAPSDTPSETGSDSAHPFGPKSPTSTTTTVPPASCAPRALLPSPFGALLCPSP